MCILKMDKNGYISIFESILPSLSFFDVIVPEIFDPHVKTHVFALAGCVKSHFSGLKAP